MGQVCLRRKNLKNSANQGGLSNNSSLKKNTVLAPDVGALIPNSIKVIYHLILVYVIAWNWSNSITSLLIILLHEMEL